MTYPFKMEVGPFRIVQELKDAPVQIFDPDGNNIGTVARFTDVHGWIINTYPQQDDD